MTFQATNDSVQDIDTDHAPTQTRAEQIADNLGTSPSQPMSDAVKSLLISALANSQHGVSVISLSGDLLYSNRAGQEALRKLGWQQEPASHKYLLEQLQSVITQGRPLLTSTTITQHEIIMHVAMPVRCGSMHAVLLQTTNSSDSAQTSTQLFAEESNLTPSEGRVLSGIVQGLKPKLIAKDQGIALSTVITHISAIRHKTRCSSVSELLAKLRSLPDMFLPRART